MAFTKCLVESEVAFIGLHQSSWPSSLSWLSRSQASQRNRHCWNCRKCHWLQGFHGLHGLHIFHWPSLPSSWPSLPSLPSSPSWPSFSASRSSGQICHCVKNTWKTWKKRFSGLESRMKWNGCKSSAMTEECTTQGNMENCSSNSLYIYIILYLSLSFQFFSWSWTAKNPVASWKMHLPHLPVEWVSKSSLLEGTHDVAWNQQ